MSIRFHYAIYDEKRDRYVKIFDADGDKSAMEEFCFTYRMLVRPPNWEKRKLGRYFLVGNGKTEAGVFKADNSVRVVMQDVEVRLEYEWFRMEDPPHDDAASAALDAEYARLDAIDEARLAPLKDELDAIRGPLREGGTKRAGGIHL